MAVIYRTLMHKTLYLFRLRITAISVDIHVVTGYWPDERALIPVKGRDFYLFRGSGTHAACYPMNTGGSSFEKNRPEHEAHHSHIVRKWRMHGPIPLFPHTPSWRAQGQLHHCTFTLYQEMSVLFWWPISLRHKPKKKFGKFQVKFVCAIVMMLLWNSEI
jgi:hypothetical protein